MPFREQNVMDERIKFIGELRQGELNMSQLCRKYGISRTIGYKFKGRYESEGAKGLFDKGRAPRCHPNATPKPIEDAIIALRRKHPTWGPKKLRPTLERRGPQVVWPHESTMAVIIHRHGLAGRPRRRHRAPPQASPLTPCQEANDVWAIDFKGYFRTGDGDRCDPLSMSDLATRFVLRLQAVDHTDTEHVWAIVEAALHEYGLPDVMRSDSGPPFASTGVGGLSQLSIRLIKAGIRPERIAPGKPTQNGRHERLHRTLKQETAHPPAPNIARQQKRFAKFRRVFNEERPHEALGFVTPASLYRASRRRYSGFLRSPEYPAHNIVRRVRRNGDIRWKGDTVFLSTALIGEPVGIEEMESGLWAVRYGPLLLAHLDSTKLIRLKPGACPRLEA
jgi:transposase InsO family protein